MAKSFEALVKKTCSKDVIIQGYKKAMNYWIEYIGMPNLIKDDNIVLHSGLETKKIFRPYSVTTKTVSHYSPPKKRDPARRWKK
jgi:cytochrome c-type biogenesis protein CcmE